MSYLKQELGPAQVAAFNDAYRCARLKPYNAAKGHLRRRLNIGGAMFEEGAWKQVTHDQAERLAEIHQIDTDPNSPLAFDLVTYEEMKRLDMLEKKVKLGVATGSEVSELTGEVVLGDATGQGRAPVDFTGVKGVDPSMLEPKGIAVRDNGGDLTSEELKAGQAQKGPQKSKHPNRKPQPAQQ